jgi:hypothetical protein
MSEAPNSHDEDRESRNRRDRRLLRFALLFSIAFHILILLFGPIGDIDLQSNSAGPNRGDSQAARGEMDVISMSSAPPAVITPPVRPVITLDAITPIPVQFVETPPLELPPVPVLNSGFGTTQGNDPSQSAGAGLPTGRGAGNAGTAASGTARITAPVPVSIFFPESHSALRGRSIRVHVYVNALGQVVSDSTRLTPPTTNSSFNQQILQNAASWRFRPARENNAPVAAWWFYDIDM